jgi:putative PIG3 family NAD(P)H quinone oxidoreductase
MKAVLISQFGNADQLQIGDWEKPEPKAAEVLVRVHATALNRADILQREGRYPVPLGASPILGLEIAGEVVALGEDVTKQRIGDKVFGLVPGGGYAEYAVIHQDMAMPMPSALTFAEAAAIPEAFLTAFQALNWLAKLQSHEHILIHAGASGVGTAAIQLAREIGIKGIITTTSKPKIDFCLSLGASMVIDYKAFDFKQEVLNYTENKGISVIIDFVGADYFQQNIDCLAIDGRLVLLGFLGGMKLSEFNLGTLLMKRLQIIGSTLRSRSLPYQIQLTAALQSFMMPRLEAKALNPVIDTIFAWTSVAEAHRYMESNQNKGKIVLEII